MIVIFACEAVLGLGALTVLARKLGSDIVKTYSLFKLMKLKVFKTLYIYLFSINITFNFQLKDLNEISKIKSFYLL